MPPLQVTQANTHQTRRVEFVLAGLASHAWELLGSWMKHYAAVSTDMTSTPLLALRTGVADGANIHTLEVPIKRILPKQQRVQDTPITCHKKRGHAQQPPPPQRIGDPNALVAPDINYLQRIAVRQAEHNYARVRGSDSANGAQGKMDDAAQRRDAV